MIGERRNIKITPNHLLQTEEALALLLSSWMLWHHKLPSIIIWPNWLWLLSISPPPHHHTHTNTSTLPHPPLNKKKLCSVQYQTLSAWTHHLPEFSIDSHIQYHSLCFSKQNIYSKQWNHLYMVYLQLKSLGIPSCYLPFLLRNNFGNFLFDSLGNDSLQKGARAQRKQFAPRANPPL